jgi:hypothetical protein
MIMRCVVGGLLLVALARDQPIYTYIYIYTVYISRSASATACGRVYEAISLPPGARDEKTRFFSFLGFFLGQLFFQKPGARDGKSATGTQYYSLNFFTNSLYFSLKIFLVVVHYIHNILQNSLC